MKFSAWIALTCFYLVGIISPLVASAPTASTSPEPPTPVFAAIDGRDDVQVIGPASYEELKKIVDGKKLHKRALGGVYLCDRKLYHHPLSSRSCLSILLNEIMK